MTKEVQGLLFLGGAGVLAYFIFVKPKTAAASTTRAGAPSTAAQDQQVPIGSRGVLERETSLPPLIPPPTLGDFASDADDISKIRDAYHPIGYGPALEETAFNAAIDESLDRVV